MPGSGAHKRQQPAIHQPGHEPVALVDAPAERVGLLLAEVRTRQGLRLHDVADRIGGSFDATQLMALESGAIRVGPEVLAELGRIYGVEPQDLVPPRDQLIVDLNEGYMRAGPDIALLDDGAGRRDVLRSYLDMLWELREVPPGTSISLRAPDIEVLAAQLGADPEGLESDLRRLMVAGAAHDSRPNRVLVSLAVALAAVTGGVLLWQGSDDTVAQGEPTAVASVVTSSPDSATPLPPAPTVEIGEAATLEREGTAEDVDALPVAPSAEIGEAAVLERNPDGSAGEQTTR